MAQASYPFDLLDLDFFRGGSCSPMVLAEVGGTLRGRIKNRSLSGSKIKVVDAIDIGGYSRYLTRPGGRQVRVSSLETPACEANFLWQKGSWLKVRQESFALSQKRFVVKALGEERGCGNALGKRASL